MLARLEQSAALLSADDLKRAKHALIVLPKAASLDALRGGRPIVPSDGQLFIRTFQHLWCIGQRK